MQQKQRRAGAAAPAVDRDAVVLDVELVEPVEHVSPRGRTNPPETTCQPPTQTPATSASPPRANTLASASSALVGVPQADVERVLGQRAQPDRVELLADAEVADPVAEPERAAPRRGWRR